MDNADIFTIKENISLPEAGRENGLQVSFQTESSLVSRLEVLGGSAKKKLTDGSRNKKEVQLKKKIRG